MFRELLTLRSLRQVFSMTPSALENLQIRKLRVAIGYAYTNVPFYCERFDQAGVRPDDIRTVDDMALLLAYPLHTGPFRYKLVIEPEISVDREIDRKRFALQAGSHFAARLEQLIIENPADWQGWSYPELSRVEDAATSPKSVHVSVR